MTIALHTICFARSAYLNEQNTTRREDIKGTMGIAHYKHIIPLTTLWNKDLYPPVGLTLCPSSFHSLDGRGGAGGGEIKRTEIMVSLPSTNNTLQGRGGNSNDKARLMATRIKGVRGQMKRMVHTISWASVRP